MQKNPFRWQNFLFMLNQKFIKLLDFFQVKILKLDTKMFLVITKGVHSSYLQIPTGLIVKKNGLNLIFQYNIKKLTSQLMSDLTFFYSKLENLNVNLEQLYTKKLLLQGLGLKAILTNLNILELKLGFSHIISLSIPNTIKINIIKNILIIESSDLILLGNFAARIKNFRQPDSYKGKGICYKNEVLFLKAVKKV